MNLINNTHTIFSIDEAYIVASDMNDDDDDDWTYKVVPNPNPDGPKTAVIEIYDEENDFVSLL